MDEIDNESYIRANIKLPEDVSSSVKIAHDVAHIPIVIAANQSKSGYIFVPFPGDLRNDSEKEILSLNYNRENSVLFPIGEISLMSVLPFNVPERKFNELARSIITHIRMSVNKDPKIGLYMVPAASFYYTVFANEAAKQTVFLDKLGDHKAAASYLETLMGWMAQSFQNIKKTSGEIGSFNLRLYSVYRYGYCL